MSANLWYSNSQDRNEILFASNIYSFYDKLSLASAYYELFVVFLVNVMLPKQQKIIDKRINSLCTNDVFKYILKIALRWICINFLVILADKIII